MWESVFVAGSGVGEGVYVLFWSVRWEGGSVSKGVCVVVWSVFLRRIVCCSVCVLGSIECVLGE